MFSSGSSGSLLTGARLLQRAVSTSAELHAFASTCKNPPECHDAFTNTDSSKFSKFVVSLHFFAWAALHYSLIFNLICLSVAVFFCFKNGFVVLSPLL